MHSLRTQSIDLTFEKQCINNSYHNFTKIVNTFLQKRCDRKYSEINASVLLFTLFCNVFSTLKWLWQKAIHTESSTCHFLPLNRGFFSLHSIYMLDIRYCCTVKAKLQATVHCRYAHQWGMNTAKSVIQLNMLVSFN